LCRGASSHASCSVACTVGLQQGRGRPKEAQSRERVGVRARAQARAGARARARARAGVQCLLGCAQLIEALKAHATGMIAHTACTD